MYVTARVVNEKSLDLDGGGKAAVQILDTGFRYPLLARWQDPNSPQNPTKWAVAGHFVAKLPQESLQKISDALNLQDLQIRRLVAPDVYRIGPTPTSPDFDAVSRNGEVLEKLEQVRTIVGEGGHVEPDYLYFIAQAPIEPDDEDFKLQGYLQVAKIPDAWVVQKGSRKVRVAIIDTGVDADHPDLKDNILRDANGAVLGWDYHNGQSNADDDHSHGTICAGLLGAMGNNKTGIAGVNWEVSIMPLKAFDATGTGTTSHIVAAFQFAIDNNADVILCAWGSSSESLCLRAAIERANEKGILVVAAAGNNPLNLDQEGQVHFPASFDLPNLISVGGCDDKGEPVLLWGHGLKRVHVSAPGVQIYSTVPTRFRPFLPYALSNGTSPAAALVAGSCALFRAQYPTLAHLKIRDLLVSSVQRSAATAAPKSAPTLNLGEAFKLAPAGPGGEGGSSEPVTPPRESPPIPPMPPSESGNATFSVDLAP